jgi:hypothetical protein
MATGKEVTERIESFSVEHRQMLADLIEVLSLCFGKGKGMAMVVFVPPEEDIAQMFMLNCDEQDAYSMSAFALEQTTEMLTIGMPEKEMLN